jgi:hypothetical protein
MKAIAWGLAIELVAFAFLIGVIVWALSTVQP